VSGILATAQQVGNALGVAVTGAVFLSTVHEGYGKAFAASLAELACLVGVMVAVSWLLPSRRRVPIDTASPAMVAGREVHR
jgi:hypothetical protein